MKKITVLSLTIAFIIGGCARNKPVETTVLGGWTDYYLIPNTLKGKVKEIKELNYWAVEKDGEVIRGELMTRKDLDSVGSTPNLAAYFDDKGVISKYEILDGETVFNSRTATIENGKWTRWDYKMKDSIQYYIIPQYDDSGYLAGINVYRPQVDTLVNKVVFVHDGKGNYNRFEYYNYKNEKTGYHVCTLDEKGNVTEAKYYNKADSLASTMKNVYDDDSNIIKQQVDNEKPKSTEVWEYKNFKLDDKGNMIEYYSDVDNGKFKIIVQRSYVYY